MLVTETSADGLKREFKIVVPAKDIADRVEARLQEICRTVRVPGFRPGRVPLSLMRQRYATGVHHEVVEKAVGESVSQVIKDRGLRTAMEPTIKPESLAEGQDLAFLMTVELLPDIEPCEFGKIVLERLTVAVADEEVEQVLARLADESRPATPVTDGRGAAPGDLVVMDTVATVEGAPLPSMSGKGIRIEIGKASGLPGLSEQVQGIAVGDRRTIAVTIPEGHPEKALIGKTVTIEITATEVSEQGPAAIDDSLAARHGLTDLDTLRRTVREQLQRNYAQASRSRLKRQLLDKLAEGHDFPVPPGLAEAEFRSIWDKVQSELKEGGAAAADLGRPESEVQAEYRAIAERRVRLGLLLSEVGRRNNIQVTRDELGRAIMAEARRYPGQERAVLDHFKNNPEQADRFRAPLFEEKVVDFILELAQVSERVVSAEELARTDPDAVDSAA